MTDRITDKQKGEANGFILIAVLWISMILSVLALNYASSVRLQGVQVLNLQDRYKKSQILESGIDLGYHQFILYRDNRSLLEKKEEIEAVAGQKLNLWYPRFEPYNATIGEKEIAVRLLNESGKININRIDLNFLQKILTACGIQMGTERTAIANSILDWQDKDSMVRAEGAEKDYYLSLDSPYLPKNMDIESIEELLLIKGVTPELFYGTEEKPGLKIFFTVRGQNQKLDINSADPRSFLLIEDFPMDVVKQIVARRKEKPIKELEDLSQIVPLRYFGQLKKYFQVTQIKHLKIEAGENLDSEVSRTYQKTFKIGG